MSRISDKEIKEVIRSIIAEKDNYPEQLKFALPFCKSALKLDGEMLREKCKYILGNLIFWKEFKSVKIKRKLRKYAFRSLEEPNEHNT